ncbi:MAG TPA: heme-binding protein [Polyangiaceae bacterium]
MDELQPHPVHSIESLTLRAGISSGLSAEQRLWAGRASLAASALGLASGAYLSAQARPPLRQLGMLAVGASIVGGVARWQFGRVFNWQPPYTVEAREGELELRRYGQEIHAVTVVADRWEQCLEEGFKRLVAYISGANAGKTTIPMTSPVLSTIAPRASLPPSDPTFSEAPHESRIVVGMLPVSALVAAGPRQVEFVMPGGVSFSALPVPDDVRVRIVPVPERRIAALRFRGRYGGDLPAHKRNELLSMTKAAGLRPRSEVWFAGYDAPFTLPALRRNEVLVELDA